MIEWQPSQDEPLINRESSVLPLEALDSRLPHRKRWIACFAFAILVTMSLLYAQVAATVPLNSDYSSIVLEADAVLHGNIFLHGWTLTNVSFYTIDLPFYVLAAALHGLTPTLTADVPAIVYALTVGGAVWLAGRGSNRKRPAMGMLITFVLAGLPSMLLPSIVLVGVDHVATTLLIVCALLVLDVDENSELSKFRVGLFALICALTVVGDGISLLVLVLPTLIVAASRATVVVDSRKRREIVILCSLIGAAVVAHLFNAAVGLAGGYETIPLKLQIVTQDMLPTNISLAIHGLLGLFRTDIQGQPLNSETIVMLFGSVALCLVIYSLFHSLTLWHRKNLPEDRIAQILGLSMLINLAAYVADAGVSSIWNTLYSPPERYLVPFFICGTILAGRLGADKFPSLIWLKVATAAVATMYSALFLEQLQTPPESPRAQELIQYLHERGLTHGLGSFWCASVVTVESGGTVAIRPVQADGSPKIKPLHWFSDSKWYKNEGANFLVFDIAHSSRGDFYWGNVGPGTARNTFGPPAETHRIGPYFVLIWNKNITRGLAA